MTLEQTPDLSNSTLHHSTYAHLTQEDYHKIIFDWNNTDHPYPSHETLDHLFTLQALKTPDQIAIYFENTTYTYRALDQASNQLARKIQSRYQKEHACFPKDTLIALFLDRSIEMLIGILAILKAGGAYVPIDPSFPKERIAYILKDTKTNTLLTQTHYLSLLNEYSVDCLCIDDTSTYLLENKDPILNQNQPEDLAYVMYTSGTTGQPKGVALPHTGIVNRIHWMQRTYPLNAQDCVLQKTPYGFDVSVWELFWAHQVGASLVIAKPQGHQDPDYLFHLIETHLITTLHFVPSMLTAFNTLLTDSHRQVPLSLRFVFCSGEALSAQQVHQFYQHASHPVELHNLYGPTEASIDVSFFECRPDVERVFIGKPIQNMQLYILNEAMEPVPIGVEGEIYIGGIGLAREYLNQPSLTHERFIENPFPKGSKKLYKTGDLGKWTTSGDIDYIGRNDFQLKIRGYRVELNEIEHHLSQYPGIQQCAVLAIKTLNDDIQLSAYYLSECSFPETMLRLFLKERIPNYMIPNQYHHQNTFPLSTNGKLDRKQLLSWHHSKPTSSDDYVPPKTSLEKELVEIWSKTLRHHPLGIQDSFFSLGGHSLTAAKIIAMIHDRFNKNISIATFYELENIEVLAQHLEQLSPETTSLIKLPAFSKDCLTKHKKLPLTDFQLILWLSHLFEPKAKKMNIASKKRFQGHLNKDRLKQTFIHVIDQQEALLYHIDFFFPTQKKYKKNRQIFKLFSADLTAHPHPEDVLNQSFKQLLTIYPWPKQHPLILAKLFHLKNNQTELQLCMPHLIADEHSMEDVLWSTLSKAYLNEPLSPLTFTSSFKHYLFEEYENHSQNKKEKRAFWKTYLYNADLFIFPKTAILSTKETKNQYSTYVPLPLQLFDALKEYAKQHKINGSHLLCATLVRSLWEHMDPSHKKTQQAMLINLVKSTRENLRYDHTIGCFIRVDPIKVPIDTTSLKALAYSIHQEVQKTAMQQQFSSLEKFTCFSNCFKRKSYLKSYLTKTFLPVYLLILKCFNIQNANKNALKRCWRLAAFKRKNIFLVNLNIWNNFFNPTEQTSSLFGEPVIPTPLSPIELSNLNDIVDVCFLRDEMTHTPYLVISSNLTPSFKQNIAERFIELLHHELGQSSCLTSTSK